MKKSRLFAIYAVLTFCALVFGRLWQKRMQVPLDSTVFPDENFRSMVMAQADTDRDGILSEEETSSVRELMVSYPHQDSRLCGGEDPSAQDRLDSLSHAYDGVAVDLEGIEVFGNLERLRIHNAAPDGIPFEKLKKLKYFELTASRQKEIDFTGAGHLVSATVSGVEAGSIRFHKNASLRKCCICDADISCGSLDFSGAPHLKDIRIYHTALGQLNLLENERLSELTASGCGLESVCLSGCKSLKELDLGFNRLKSLDLSENRKLDWIWLSGNDLEELDVSRCGNIRQLSISENNFSQLGPDTLKTADAGIEKLIAQDLCRCTQIDLSRVRLLGQAVVSGACEQIRVGENMRKVRLSASEFSVVAHPPTKNF